jgi:serine/threonine-protein kinase HipA
MVSAPWRDTHHPHLQAVLIVERFDRAWMDVGPWIARLPQEDFCQALGYSPGQKHEKDGGPGMDGCLRLLDGSADAEVDRLSFQLTQLAFWLMAASDGHAKNYSLFIGPGDAYAMTPLYDVISQVHRFNADPIELKGN